MTALPDTTDPAERLLAGLAAAAGAGEATVAAFYAAASDRMRATLGGQAHFGRALANDRFAPLIGWPEATLLGVDRIGDSARGTLLLGAGSDRCAFVLAVALARHGERSGEWCLSGIAREGVDL